MPVRISMFIFILNLSVISFAQTNIQVTGLTVSDNTPNEQQSITYTITIRNNGPQAATALQFTDLLPAGLTFVSSVPAQGTYTAATGIWDVGALASGQNRTLTINATVNAGTSGNTITNTAGYLSSTPADNNVSDNTRSVDITVNRPDIQVTKTVNNSTPDVGQTVLYTIKAKNVGTNDAPATGLVIADLLPTGLTYVPGSSTIPAGTTYNAGTGAWTIGTLNDNVELTLVLAATVNSGTTGYTLVNTANVFSIDQTEESTANNLASASLTVRFPDISVVKTVTIGPYNENVNLTYTVTVKNNGPAAATGLQIKDLLSSSLAYVSSTVTQGTYTSGTGIWDIGALASGQTRVLTITAYPKTGTSGTAVNNLAILYALDQNDTNTANNSSSVEIEVATVDLLLEKSVNDNSPDVGQEIEFSLKLTNLGPGIGSNIIITDTIPAGLTFTSISGLPAGSSAVHSAGTVTWTIPTRTIGNMTLKFKATVNAGYAARTIVNKAGVQDFDQVDPVRANNTSSVSMIVNGADLQVTKTVSNVAPNPGDNITYTLIVTNLGPLASNDVIIEDVLPSGVTYVSSSADESSYLIANNRWGSTGNLDLAIGETRTLTINATVNAGTIGNSYLNTATIISAAQPDGIISNNSSSALIAIGEADLGVTKTASAPADGIAYVPGETVTYTITVRNYGPHSAPLVWVTDILPSTLTYVSSAPGIGTYNATTGIWAVGTINNGTSATLILTATVNSGVTTAGKTITNTATVSSPMNEPAGASNSNTASADIHVHGADIGLTKTTTASGTTVEGDSFSYTVTVTNNGPDAATGVQITDFVPLNLNIDSYTPSEGIYTQSSGLWTGISLNNGESATLTFNVTVKSGGGFTNTARVTASDQGDSNSGNDEASVFISALKTFAAGSCIIDMNNTTLLTLKVYGLVHEIVKKAQVPVWWAIRPDKSFGSETGKVDEIDFTVDGVDYYTGAFIIEKGFVADAQSIIDQWIAANPGLGALIHCNQPTFQAPIHAELTSFPRAVLDQQNGGIVESFFYNNTGLTNNIIGYIDPPTNKLPIYDLYRPDGTPSNLSACDDIYAMPHADPQLWTVLERETFDAFVKNGGWIWVACHAVSALETLVDLPGDPTPAPDANYLSVDGLIPWGDHSDGTPPYSYSINTGHYAGQAASDPFMQFRGTIDGALESGSESIYVPYASGWRPTTTIGIWDPDFYAQTGEGTPGAIAAKLAYGHAFGNPDYGMVVYEASHSIVGGTVAENVGAARIYGNFWFEAGIEFRPEIVPTSIPVAIEVGQSGLFSVDVFGQVDNSTTFTYQWVSNCSGTFSAPNEKSTTFTPDQVDEPTECIVRLIVVDECGRQNFLAKTYIVYPRTDLSVEKTAPATIIAGENITYSLTVLNLGPKKGIDVQVEDVLPTGLTYISSSASVGSYNNSTGIWTIGLMLENTSETITILAEVGSNVAAGTVITNTAHVSSLSTDVWPENDTDDAVTTVETKVDLELAKSVNNSAPVVGSNVIFSIEVTNQGPSDGTGFTVSDLLPNGYNYLGDDGGGSYNETSGIWTYGGLESGSSVTINITAQVLTSGNYLNYAQIKTSNEDDDDSTPGNDSTTEDDDDTAITVPVLEPYPIANNDAFNVCAGSILAGNLFADNGNGADFDPQGDSFTVIMVNGNVSPANVGTEFALASGALLTVTNTGSLSYNPNGATGSDSFTYVINDGTNNSTEATVSITINDLPNCSVLGNAAVCQNTTGETYTGPAGMDSYAWSVKSGSATITSATDAVSVDVDFGITSSTLQLIVTKNGCSSTCEITVTVNSVPEFSIEKSDVTCFGDNTGWIKITGTGGSGTYFYSTDNGTTYTSPAQSGPYTFNNLGAGEYKIRIKDANECETPSCD